MVDYVVELVLAASDKAYTTTMVKPHKKKAPLLLKKRSRTHSQRWSSVLSTTPSPFFSVRVLAHHHVDIGFTTRAKFEPNKGHELHPGFFFGCERGYSYSEHEKKPFPKQRGKLVVTASFNHAAREISFEVNGQMLISPFCLVPTDAPLYPIVRLGEREASVEMTGGHWCEDV
ncbi:hypothetical protein SDRG_14924 [Saprolegnia diclina VS20]|uniref:SPRY domain-containing protein n=1 Tax=Saprolegnia diclina (strain VS20) TaxID=1156394 RepID=T0R5F9_SAPDV|nr:hypothetical protein SDRG_14924 [Saprolegnia diclina VS20]EQC27303.1 hypothetical protein SDRG_14924 [Saprolegnia diclina VS20]|eukprot:XP_008619306.1 hypothetical protein SDRG_14924 [Saprolegnia diclina VS20]